MMNLQSIADLLSEIHNTTHEPFPFLWVGVFTFQALCENA